MKKLFVALLTICLVLTALTITFADVSQDTIKQVQTKLNELGYDCGTPDGIAGQHTKDAVMRYQTDNGLDASGEITDELLDIIESNVVTNETDVVETKNEETAKTTSDRIKNARDAFRNKVQEEKGDSNNEETEAESNPMLDKIEPITDFDLHSGVSFGDSMEEVQSKELQKGFKPTNDYSYAEENTLPFYGNFAGIDGAYLVYSFLGDHLYNARYDFSTDETHSPDTAYSSVSKLLREKYGEPSKTPFDLSEFNDNHYVSSYSDRYFENMIESGSLKDHEHWLFKLGSRYLLIDHYILNHATGGAFYDHRLTYTRLSKEQVLETLAKNKKENPVKEKTKETTAPEEDL